MDDGCIWNGIDLDGLLDQAVEKLASAGRRAAVEPERKFVEIVVQIFVADGSLMGSQEPAFEQGYHTMDMGKQMFANRLTTLDLPIVEVAFQTQVGRQSVGANRTARLDGLDNKSVQSFLRQIGNPTQPNSPHFSTVQLDAHDHQGFFLGRSANHAFFRTAPVGLVDLHQTPQAVSTRSRLKLFSGWLLLILRRF